MTEIITRDEMMAEFAALGGGVPDSVQYRRFCTLAIKHPIAARMAAIDPFSDDYAALAMELYVDLRGRAGSYEPERDEESGGGCPPDVWHDTSPWSFRDTSMIAEFLFSWGQIMRCLALPPAARSRVLEYGTGSGQLLLFLARAGLQTYAVDIDEASLAQVRAQADAMKLDVRTQRARFGEGFPGQKFDRIIFFEAFHHAIDFLSLLDRLQDQLEIGGRLVFCGEPIIDAAALHLPYAWGPRLDVLSAFCIRRFGWMELGFTKPFFVEALQRHGWFVEHHPSVEYGRASAFVARSYLGQAVEMGAPLDLGKFSDGWEAPEGTHRFTKGGMARLPLPVHQGSQEVRIAFFNPLPVSVDATLTVGETALPIVLEAGVPSYEVTMPCSAGDEVSILTEGRRPCELFDSKDTRCLGIAVRTFAVHVS